MLTIHCESRYGGHDNLNAAPEGWLQTTRSHASWRTSSSGTRRTCWKRYKRTQPEHYEEAHDARNPVLDERWELMCLTGLLPGRFLRGHNCCAPAVRAVEFVDLWQWRTLKSIYGTAFLGSIVAIHLGVPPRCPLLALTH
jgi:hypothetical protein